MTPASKGETLPCVPIGTICWADASGDCTVSVNDILAVINAWGPCGSTDQAPQSVSDCEAKCAQQFPGYGNDYTDCVQKCVRALCEAGILPPEDCP